MKKEAREIIKTILTSKEHTDVLELCLKISRAVFKAKAKRLFTKDNKSINPKLMVSLKDKLLVKGLLKRPDIDNGQLYHSLVRPVSREFLHQGL